VRENPVRTSARFVMGQAQGVRLDAQALDRLAQELLGLPPNAWEGRYHFRGEEELTLRYLLVLDTLNYCFWPDKSWHVVGPEGERLSGYFALAYALRRAAENAPEFFDPQHLAHLDEPALRDVLGDIPLLPWRVQGCREVGRVLVQWGSARAFFAAARGSCFRLVELLTAHFPSFRDSAVYRGRWVCFHKRAQILCADLAGTFAERGPGALEDLAWLTAFADYKLPQILWARGALVPHPRLAQRILAKEEIPAGSPEEVEIRAATVWAGEELTQRLYALGRKIRAFEVDWLLWNLSQGPLSAPHHRTLTWAY